MRQNSLLVKIGISVICLGWSFPAFADTHAKVITALQNQTDIPARFPKILPDAGEENIYLNGSVDRDSYLIHFDYTSDCEGSTACSMGYFAADKNAPIPLKSDYSGDYDEYQYVQLNNGYNAVFAKSCGAYCIASVAWKINGVAYSVSLKNGTKQETMRIANSVY